MKSYEIVLVLHPDLEIDIDTPIAKVEKLIEGVKGKITKKDNWGKKRLAYPVKKQHFGIYVYLEADLEPETVRNLESQFLITEEIIRFLVVNKLVLQRARTQEKVQAKAAAAASAKE